MKSEGLILAGVLGVCALFGVGVSQVATPAVKQTVESISHQSTEESAPVAANESLRESLAAHYPKVELTDEILQSLTCGEEKDWLGNKDCYEGPTKEVKRYGTASVIMDGKTVYVQLVSMPAGAFLVK
jgi:hypothetical protein